MYTKYNILSLLKITQVIKSSIFFLSTEKSSIHFRRTKHFKLHFKKAANREKTDKHKESKVYGFLPKQIKTTE